MHSLDDWLQTKFILFEDGTLQSVVFEGGEIISTERHLDEAGVAFIRDNIRNFVSNAPEIEACDGEAWQFEGPDYYFDLGYIYGTDLIKIANILSR